MRYQKYEFCKDVKCQALIEYDEGHLCIRDPDKCYYTAKEFHSWLNENQFTIRKENTMTHISMLGKPVRDKVTGFRGIVTSISFDLSGCIQALVTPQAREGKLIDSAWMDISRVIEIEDVPRIAAPDFNNGPISEGKKGPIDKPQKGR